MLKHGPEQRPERQPEILPDALAALHAACFTTPRPWSAAEIKSLADGPHVFVIAQPLGFVMGQAIAGEAELLTIAVSPQVRRQGLGQSLLAAFLAQARLRGADRALLEVAAGNTAAIALYRAAGFADAGRRKGYYHHPDGSREDALVLALAL